MILWFHRIPRDSIIFYLMYFVTNFVTGIGFSNYGSILTVFQSVRGSTIRKYAYAQVGSSKKFQVMFGVSRSILLLTECLCMCSWNIDKFEAGVYQSKNNKITDISFLSLLTRTSQHIIWISLSFSLCVYIYTYINNKKHASIMVDIQNTYHITINNTVTYIDTDRYASRQIVIGINSDL